MVINTLQYDARYTQRQISSVQVITMVIFHCNCVCCFSILVSAGSQKRSLVWYTSKYVAAHKPTLHIRHTCSFVLGGTHSTEFSYTARVSVYCALSQVCFWLVDGACLLRLAVRGRGTLPASCIRSLTNVSLNFEPQEARIIKPLRMVRSIKWQNSFFVRFQFRLIIE